MVIPSAIYVYQALANISFVHPHHTTPTALSEMSSPLSKLGSSTELRKNNASKSCDAKHPSSLPTPDFLRAKICPGCGRPYHDCSCNDGNDSGPPAGWHCSRCGQPYLLCVCSPPSSDESEDGKGQCPNCLNSYAKCTCSSRKKGQCPNCLNSYENCTCK